MTDIDQFRTSNPRLPTVGVDSFEETVLNYHGRGWTDEKIADQMYRSRSFIDASTVPGQKPISARGVGWDSLLKRVRQAIEASSEL
jgi:hypothetical protein